MGVCKKRLILLPLMMKEVLTPDVNSHMYESAAKL